MSALAAFLRRERFLLTIFAVAFALRLAVTLPAVLAGGAAEAFSRPDTPGYLQPALALADSGEYLDGPGGAPSVTRAPGFPFFAAAVLRCSGGSFGALAVVLALVNAAAVLPIGWGTRRLFGAGPSLAAAGVTALHLTAVAQGPMFLSDSLFFLCAAVQFWCFALFYTTKRAGYFPLTMFTAAVGALIRPINVAWVWPALFLVAVFPGAQWRWKWRCAISGALVFFGVLLPWQLRNASLGAGMCIDVNTGAMYHQNGAMLLAAANGTEYETEKQRILAELETTFRDAARFPDEKSRVDYRLKRFAELIRQHPLLWISQHFRWEALLPDVPTFCEVLGVTRSDRGTLNVLRSRGIFAAADHYFDGRYWILLPLLPLLACVGLLYLGAAGMLVCWIRNVRRDWYWILLFLAFAEYYFFLPGPITVPRYQLPALPMLAAMAGEFCRRAAKSGCFQRFHAGRDLK